MTENFLDLPDGRRLAFHKTPARDATPSRPGVVFLGGLCSDMTGTKATFLEQWAIEAGHEFLRFDYTGHGTSSGKFEDGCISDWAQDADDAIQQLAPGPQVLVGSSMGGWVGLLLACKYPETVVGMVGIAAAPDFTDEITAALTDEQRTELTQHGRILMESEYDDPYVITQHLLDDGARNRLLDRPLPARIPIRLLHGTADEDVPVTTALRTIDALESVDARLILVKGADHRMSGPDELALLQATVEDVLARTLPE